MPGHPFKTPRIVQPSGRRPLLLLVLLALVAALAAWLAYDYGQRRGGYFAGRSDARIGELEQRLRALTAECDEQRELAARYQRASQIDRAAVGQVREELAALQEERSELEQQVAFLRSLISGEVNALQVSRLTLEREGEGNSYRFSFLVSKRAKSDARISGTVDLKLVGQLQGRESVLASDKLGLSGPLKMGFKHFQKFEGTLELPAGFIPRELLISGRPDGKKFKPFEQRLKWKVG